MTVFTVTAPDRIPEKAVSNWENSPGHLATMIDPNCDTVGVGVTIDNGRAFCYMFVGNPTAHNPYA
ncbi:CAP domain-containing protein [Dysosmobacter sp.]|uniref:CAP domain-containing protein n=1 Tax=Dysosmobacter sp. TaxID=2591382 RepID=UPI003FD786A2